MNTVLTVVLEIHNNDIHKKHDVKVFRHEYGLPGNIPV